MKCRDHQHQARYAVSIAIGIAVTLLSAAPEALWGQSSSLYVNPSGQQNNQRQTRRSANDRQSRADQNRRQDQPNNARTQNRPVRPRATQARQGSGRFAQPRPSRRPRNNTATGQPKAPHELSPAIRQMSAVAVDVPKPRSFAVNDLVTIIIRESTETEFEATLETEKSSEHSAEIAELPRLTLGDLADLQLRQNDFENGTPQLDVTSDRSFEGEGDYSRSEEMTGRLTARVADVKPNGTLALEAKKFVKSDGESLNITLTGTCRAEDVTADNTVLSTEIYNLHLNKTHEGELEDATEKGLFTKILDFVFNF
jgi:flagellar L-ring protein precursor FlgH